MEPLQLSFRHADCVPRPEVLVSNFWEELSVIRLTRLNGQELAVNSDLIKFIEKAPDTVVTLTNGEKIIVRENTEQVLERIIAFRRAVLAGMPAVGHDPNSATATLGRREADCNHPAGVPPRG